MTLHVETWYDTAAEDATPCGGDITSPRGTASPRGSSLRGGTEMTRNDRKDFEIR